MKRLVAGAAVAVIVIPTLLSGCVRKVEEAPKETSAQTAAAAETTEKTDCKKKNDLYWSIDGIFDAGYVLMRVVYYQNYQTSIFVRRFFWCLEEKRAAAWF